MVPRMVSDGGLMRRAYVTVWDMANPPNGSIKLRFQ